MSIRQSTSDAKNSLGAPQEEDETSLPSAPPDLEKAFLEDIQTHPEDDAPRLIYADWLEGRNGPGDSERAELIRVQVWAAGLPEGDAALKEYTRRETELLQHPDIQGKLAPYEDICPAVRGLGGYPDFSCAFRRGLPCFEVTVEGQKVPAIPVLIQQLKESADPFSSATLAKIGTVAKEVIPLLIQTLNDPDSNARYWAVSALAELGPDAREAVPALIGATKDSDPEVRTQAAGALWALKIDVPEARRPISLSDFFKGYY